MYDDLFDQLLEAMLPLARVRQNPRYHPEGDALFHALQTFDLAASAGEPPHLVAAALFHDLGKASADGPHEAVGAGLLTGLADERTCFLVARHMDLLRDAPGARRAYAGHPWLDDLERLRDYDDRGRRPNAHVPTIERALGWLLEPGVAEAWLDPSRVTEDV